MRKSLYGEICRGTEQIYGKKMSCTQVANTNRFDKALTTP